MHWTVDVPEDVSHIVWKITAQDQLHGLSDAMSFEQKVVPLLPLTVREANLLQAHPQASLSLTAPANAQKGRTQVRIHWQASLVNGPIASARLWMNNYPYGCMEQRSSRAAVSGDVKQWQAVMAMLPRHIDENGLVRYFPETPGSEILTAYLLDIAEAYRLPLPATEKQRMQAALVQALQRETSRDWIPDKTATLSYQLALQAAIAPSLSGAKAVIPGDLNKLPTIALIDWARYLLVQPATSERQQQLRQVTAQLRKRYDIQGTKLIWRGDGSENQWWFMWTPEVAVAKTAILAQRLVELDASWKTDLPLLISHLANGQQQGSWRTTTGNVWAVAALTGLAKQSEVGLVNGQSSAQLGTEQQTLHWSNVGLSSHQIFTLPDSAATTQLRLQHTGQGAPWATVHLLAAVPGIETVRGLSVKKTITPVEQKVIGQWSAGDLLQVTLDMHSESDIGWVVVHDPIPSGASILGKGLARETQLDRNTNHTNKGDRWWWSPNNVERTNDSYRGYYQRVWRGNWQASYLLRLNNAGQFHFPSTRIEAMYAPEIFGETPNQSMDVGGK